MIDSVAKPVLTLSDLLDGQDRRVPGDHILVVVAHPDDETLACGAQLARWVGVRLIIVTDGAPPNMNDARRLGFESAREYARVRQRECRHALSLAGIPARNTQFLELPDQSASERIASIADRVAAMLAFLDTRAVVTHAYEGGHPDHDAVALAVHLAVDRVAPTTRPILVEVPLYSARQDGGWCRQHYCTPGPAELVIDLTPEQIELKRAMADCHTTQASTLRSFDFAQERFREAPRYDFTRPPNEGLTLYERYDWGTSPLQWSQRARRAISERPHPHTS